MQLAELTERRRLLPANVADAVTLRLGNGLREALNPKFLLVIHHRLQEGHEASFEGGGYRRGFGFSCGLEKAGELTDDRVASVTEFLPSFSGTTGCLCPLLRPKIGWSRWDASLVQVGCLETLGEVVTRPPIGSVLEELRLPEQVFSLALPLEDQSGRGLRGRLLR